MDRAGENSRSDAIQTTLQAVVAVLITLAAVVILLAPTDAETTTWLAPWTAK